MTHVPFDSEFNPGDELVRIGSELAGRPANEDILNCPFSPFATGNESQQRIQHAIQHAIEQQQLSIYDVFEKVRAVLQTIPSVTQAERMAFSVDACRIYISEGLPVHDSIFISAFERALGIPLADL